MSLERWNSEIQAAVMCHPLGRELAHDAVSCLTNNIHHYEASYAQAASWFLNVIGSS